MKFRVTIIRGDEVLAMRTLPIDGYATMLQLDSLLLKFIRGLDYKPQQGDKLDYWFDPEFYVWNQNPAVWISS